MIDTQRKHTIRIENSHQFNQNKPFDEQKTNKVRESCNIISFNNHEWPDCQVIYFKQLCVYHFINTGHLSSDWILKDIVLQKDLDF